VARQDFQQAQSPIKGLNCVLFGLVMKGLWPPTWPGSFRHSGALLTDEKALPIEFTQN
jgi:hypothetical protein